MQRISAYEPYVHRGYGLLAYCPQSSQVLHLNHVCLYMAMQLVHLVPQDAKSMRGESPV
jgi:hypothetical protein